MDLPRFRRNESWIEALCRDVALGMTLHVLLVTMQYVNSWFRKPPTLLQMVQDVFGSSIETAVAMLAALFLVFAGRLALPDRGGWRWFGLGVLVVVASAAGLHLLRWLNPPPDLTPSGLAWFAALQHQLTVAVAAVAGMVEFRRNSLRAEEALHRAQLDRIALDGELAAGRLQVLQAQIEPHFLFNSLANLRRLMHIDGVAGQAMLADLLRYLEVALPRMRDAQSTLGSEAELARAFLAVHQVRMGARLRVEFDIPSRLDTVDVPPMMLLTLIENALKHGLQPLPEGGVISVAADADDGRLSISVADTGAGLVPGSGGGTGLANIRARLRAMHGTAATLSLQLNQPRGVIATIALPHGLA